MIRQIKDSDWPIVNEWNLEMASASFDKVIPEILNKKVKEDYEKQPEGFKVAEENGQVVGFIWFSLIPEKKSAFIHAIYVESSFRGSGLADKLLSHVESFCKEKKIENIELNVTTKLIPAIKFYQKKGFLIKRHFMSKNLNNESN